MGKILQLVDFPGSTLTAYTVQTDRAGIVSGDFSLDSTRLEGQKAAFRYARLASLPVACRQI